MTTFALAVSTFACKTGEPAHTEAIGLRPLAPPGKLDVGIYWYGKNRASQKAVKGQPNSYYDPAKPTVIFIHGWEPGSQSKATGRTAYVFTDGTAQVYTADPWLKLGWNVGAFFWDQLSDEDNVIWAENKIWKPDTGVAMRWRDRSGQFHKDDMPVVSVGDLAFQSFVDAMPGYQGSDIRIAGHSLGSQLAVILATRIYMEAQKNNLPSNLVPKRVALLDPYFNVRDDAVQWPGALVRTMVNDTKALIAYEMIKTSNVLRVPVLGPLFTDENLELTRSIGETVFKPDFVAVRGNPLATFINRHKVAESIYFMSMATSPGQCCTGGVCAPPAMAGASHESVRAFMALGKSCVQKKPMDSLADINIPQDLNDQPYVDPLATSPAADEATSAADGSVMDDSEKDGVAPDSRGDATKPGDSHGR